MIKYHLRSAGFEPFHRYLLLIIPSSFPVHLNYPVPDWVLIGVVAPSTLSVDYKGSSMTLGRAREAEKVKPEINFCKKYSIVGHHEIGFSSLYKNQLFLRGCAKTAIELHVFHPAGRILSPEQAQRFARGICEHIIEGGRDK